MIKTIIQFNCTWEKEKLQKLFDILINASGITEFGLSMVFIPGMVQEIPKASNSLDSEKYDHPADDPNFAPIKATEDSITIPHGLRTTPKMVMAVRDKTVNSKQPCSTKSDQVTTKFKEITKIPTSELGPVKKTSKPILTYAETDDGRVAIYYNESPMYATMDSVRALPDKITHDIIDHLPAGKRSALRGFKKYITGLDELEPTQKVKNDEGEKYPHGVDPYAPILTGGAKVDTHARGKIGEVS